MYCITIGMYFGGSIPYAMYLRTVINICRSHGVFGFMLARAPFDLSSRPKTALSLSSEKRALLRSSFHGAWWFPSASDVYFLSTSESPP